VSTTRIRHKFSVAEYDEMVEHGILSEEDRVELIRGEIVEKKTIGKQHAGCVNQLTQLLVLRLQGVAIISIQNPIALRDSVPEPDVAVVKPRSDFYAGSRPTAADILLLIEVADSTLEFDRTDKLQLYAESGIPEYWIVNLIDRQIEVYRQPLSPAERYGEFRLYLPGETLCAPGVPNVVFDVKDLLPGRA